MKIGIITEGQSEQRALSEIVKKIGIKDVLTPVFAPIDPKTGPNRMVKVAESRLNYFYNRNVSKVIIVIDLENIQQCLIERAKSIEEAFHRKGHPKVCVVIKNKQFENWLISDHKGISKLKNFKPSQKFIKQTGNGNADNVAKPTELLTSIKTNKKSYAKGDDDINIAKMIDPKNMVKNSRSFRKFLKELGWKDR